MGPAPMASTFWAPNAPPVCLLGVPSRASVSKPAASPDQYLVISSEMARWMGLSRGRSPDQQRRLVSGTGPGGNEPLPGRRLLPLIAQRSTLQRQTETGGLCKADTASHLPACCQSALTLKLTLVFFVGCGVVCLGGFLKHKRHSPLTIR